MAEPSLEGFGDRADLRRALAEQLATVRPDLRIVADGFLGEESAMDGLAVGAEGELVSIRFAKPSDDRATLTRALADLTWLRARRGDLLKLAPGLGIDPSVEPRALVFCRAFSAESRAAVDNLPDHTVELWRCRGAGGAEQRLLLVEPVETSSPVPTEPRSRALSPPTLLSTPRHPGRSTPAAPAPPSRADRGGSATRPLADPPSPSAFRTGLTSVDLEQTRSEPRSDPGRVKGR